MTPRARRTRPAPLVVVGLVLALCLAACGAIESRTEIVLLTGRDATGGALSRLLAQWQHDHPDAPVRVVELAPVADQQHDAMVKDAQDDSSTTDVYSLDVTWVTEFADNDWIRPLDGFDVRPFLSGPLHTGLFPPAPDHTAPAEGTLYAAPLTTDAGLLYYRRDVVAEPPVSWDDLLRGAPDAQGRGPAAMWAGQLADYEGLTVNLLEALGQVAPRRSLFEAGMPALQQAVDLLRPEPYGAPPVVLPESLTYDENGSLQAMRDGRVATLRGWPVGYRTLTAPSDEDPGRAGRLGVAQVPGGAPILGGQDLAVSEHSRHSTRARQLIDFLTGPDAQSRLLEAGAPATRADAYGAPTGVPSELSASLQTALNTAVGRPEGACYSQFSALFHHAAHEALSTGQRLPDDLLPRLEAVLDCRQRS